MVGMALVGKYATMGGYIKMGVIIVLPGGDTVCPTVWGGFMVFI